jgi:prephenate dehydrogenase
VNPSFDRVVIVGVGLIGGSLALALRALDPAPYVTGIQRDAEARAWALAHGVLDEALPPEGERTDRALLAADLVVLGTPARAERQWLERLGDLGFRGVVTDVASTKAGVVATAKRSLAEGACFVGGHPMAGSERSGVESADADLFRGAYYVLTPASDTDADAYGRLHALVTSIGARAIAIRAEEHDEAVAAISHVPHVAAAALTNLAAARAAAGDEVLRLAAGGFKDMTRIAAGSADLWTGICFDNRDAVLRGLKEYGAQVGDFAGLLEAGDRAGVTAWLSRAADVRSSLPAQWVPASTRLRELAVPVSDHPGAVSTVAQAAAHAGCNIEDIGIDHQSEDSAMLRLVLTDEGDLDALVAALRDAGLEPDLEPLRLEGGGA